MDLDQLKKIKQKAFDQVSEMGRNVVLCDLEKCIDAALGQSENDRQDFIRSHIKLIKCIGQLKCANKPIKKENLTKVSEMLDRFCVRANFRADKPDILNKFETNINDFLQVLERFTNSSNRRIKPLRYLNEEDELFLQMYQLANDTMELMLDIFLIIEGSKHLLVHGQSLERFQSWNDQFQKLSIILIEKSEILTGALKMASKQAFRLVSQYPNTSDKRFEAIFNKIYTSSPTPPEYFFHRDLIDKTTAEELYWNLRQNNEEKSDHHIFRLYRVDLVKSFLRDFIYMTVPDRLNEISFFLEGVNPKTDESDNRTEAYVKINSQNFLLVCLRLQAKQWIFDRNYMDSLLKNQQKSFNGALIFSSVKTGNGDFFIRFTNYISKNELATLIANNLGKAGWVALNLSDVVKIDRRQVFLTRVLGLSAEKNFGAIPHDQSRNDFTVSSFTQNFSDWLFQLRELSLNWFKPQVLAPAAIGLLMLVLIPTYLLYNQTAKVPFLSVVAQTQGIQVRNQTGFKKLEFSDFGSTLFSQDRFQLKVELAESETIMLMYKDSDNKISVIASGKKLKGTYFFPSADENFILDENPGDETFFLIACKKCILEASELSAHLNRGTLERFVQENLNGTLKIITFEHK